jgi:hypothetical protein
MLVDDWAELSRWSLQRFPSCSAYNRVRTVFSLSLRIKLQPLLLLFVKARIRVLKVLPTFVEKGT